MTAFTPERVEYLDGAPCPSCYSTSHRNLIGQWPGGHHGKIVCRDCNRFIKWSPKPDQVKSKRPSIQKKLVSRDSKGYCEICLVLSDRLPGPQTLEAHHVVPVEMGGGDEPENIQIVCTSCHRWIHHQRTYLGHYGNSYTGVSNGCKS